MDVDGDGNDYNADTVAVAVDDNQPQGVPLLTRKTKIRDEALIPFDKLLSQRTILFRLLRGASVRGSVRYGVEGCCALP